MVARRVWPWSFAHSSLATIRDGAAVVETGRVAGGHAGAVTERRFQLRERLHRGVVTDRLVVLDGGNGALAARDLDRHDFPREAAAVARGDRPLVRAQGPRVLFLAGHALLGRDVRAVHTHQDALFGVDQAIDKDEIFQGAVTGLVAATGTAQDVGRLRHAVDAAREDDLVIAKADGLVSKLDRAQAGATDPVDGIGGDGAVESGPEPDLAGRILPGPGLEDLPKINMPDVVAAHARAGDRLAGGKCPQLDARFRARERR